MNFKFVIEVQGHTLHGSQDYPSAIAAESAAMQVIRALGGYGSVKVLTQYPALKLWSPDQPEIDLLRRLSDGDQYNRITAVGFIRRKADCSLSEAGDYFKTHFWPTP